MPHTSHRKREQQRDKRSTVPLTDGWNLVVRSSLKPKDESTNEDLSGTTIATTASSSADPDTNAAPDETENPSQNAGISTATEKSTAATIPGLTLAELKGEYKMYMKRWKASECRKKLTCIRDGVIGDYLSDCDDGIGIQQRCFTTVCVGLGSLCGVGRARSLWQLCVWMDICDTFDNFSFKRIKRYIQEPRFTQLDKQFFSYLSITVLESPAASDIVNHETFLYAPFLQWTILLPGFLQSRHDPNLVITAALDELSSSDIDLKLGKDSEKYTPDQKEAFVQTANRFLNRMFGMKVPEFDEYPAALMGLTCYWSKVMYPEEYYTGGSEASAQKEKEESSGLKKGIEKLAEKIRDKL